MESTCAKLSAIYQPVAIRLLRDVQPSISSSILSQSARDSLQGFFNPAELSENLLFGQVEFQAKDGVHGFEEHFALAV